MSTPTLSAAPGDSSSDQGKRAKDGDQLTDPVLRPATAQDISRLKAVMAEAFHDDPILAWLMPNGLLQQVAG